MQLNEPDERNTWRDWVFYLHTILAFICLACIPVGAGIQGFIWAGVGGAIVGVVLGGFIAAPLIEMCFLMEEYWWVFLTIVAVILAWFFWDVGKG